MINFLLQLTNGVICTPDSFRHKTFTFPQKQRWGSGAFFYIYWKELFVLVRSLTGKVAFITGAGRGIGKATAIACECWG
ncbi:hypothetical protein BTR25_23710 [Bacillus sp. MRMR6]|nr:hypothetical protein BTR25_23710 [Bacillus sp. MRMR6]